MSLSSIRIAFSLFALLTLVPVSAHACEPIVPLVQLFGGPNLFARTAFWMAGAVAVKCITFLLLERSLRWYEGLGFMIIANVVSTVIGIVVTMGFAVPLGIILLAPIGIFVSTIPAQRLLDQAGWRTAWINSRSKLAFAMFAGMSITVVLWGVSQSEINQNASALYWLLKYLFVILALFISIILTAIWEEWVIAKLAKRRHGDQSFLKTVMRANYVTFAVVVGAAAMEMLPKRLHSRGFLAWWHQLSEWMGTLS